MRAQRIGQLLVVAEVCQLRTYGGSYGRGGYNRGPPQAAPAPFKKRSKAEKAAPRPVIPPAPTTPTASSTANIPPAPPSPASIAASASSKATPVATPTAPTAPTTPTPEPYRPTTTNVRRAVVVRGRRDARNRSENEVYDRVCSHSEQEHHDPKDFVNNGGLKKKLLGKDSNRVIGVIDLRKPPLTVEEVKRLPVLRAIVFLGAPYASNNSRAQNRPAPHIFPPSVKWPPIPELSEFDEVYAKYIRITPSEMAFAMLEFVPTFYVEARYVLKMMPEVAFTAVMQQERKTEDGRLQISSTFFRKYPMLFETVSGKSDRTKVRLNWNEYPCLRNHPRFGMADPGMQKFSLEREGSVGPEGILSAAFIAPNSSTDGDSSSPTKRRDSAELQNKKLEVRIMEILVMHLPRFPRQEDTLKRYEFFNLVKWINTFTPEELATIQEVPEERVIKIILRYCRIFQLSAGGHDPHLFVPHDRSPFRGITSSTTTTTSPNEDMDDGEEEEELRGTAFDDLDEGEIALEVDEAGGGAVGGSATPALTLLTDAVEGPISGDTPESQQQDKSPITTEDGACDDPAALLEQLKKQFGGPVPKAASSSSNPTDELTEEERRRVERFNASLADGLVDTDDILLSPESATPEMMDRGETAEEYNGNELIDETEPDTPAAPEEAGLAIQSEFGVLTLRRVPPGVAPRSLSDFGILNSPNMALLRTVLHLTPFHPNFVFNLAENTATPTTPSSIDGKIGFVPPAPIAAAPAQRGVWRWVPLEKIYRTLSVEQKRDLRRFKGLANFLRLHGAVFEVSEDSRYVIVIDPKGEDCPPMISTTTIFHVEDRVRLPPTFDTDKDGGKAVSMGHEVRERWAKVLGNTQIPSNRTQIHLLDPKSPLLDSVAFGEEIADFLPDHAVTIKSLISRLPPLMRAALPVHMYRTFQSSKHLAMYEDARGVAFLAKATVADGVQDKSNMTGKASLEEVMEELRRKIPPAGNTRIRLWTTLSAKSRNRVKTDFGAFDSFITAFPSVFHVEMVTSEPSPAIAVGDGRHIGRKPSIRQVITLQEHRKNSMHRPQ